MQGNPRLCSFVGCKVRAISNQKHFIQPPAKDALPSSASVCSQAGERNSAHKQGACSDRDTLAGTGFNLAQALGMPFRKHCSEQLGFAEAMQRFARLPQ